MFRNVNKEEAEWTAPRVFFVLTVWTFGSIGIVIGLYGVYRMFVLEHPDGRRLLIIGVVISNVVCIAGYVVVRIIHWSRQ